MVSVAPSTAADENAGGVWLVTVLPEKFASSWPERFLILRLGSPGWLYPTTTVSSWPTGVAKVAVTVLPAIDALDELRLVLPMVICMTLACTVTESSSASSKVTVSVAPAISALTNSGGVASGVLLVTGSGPKLGTRLPSAPRNGQVLYGGLRHLPPCALS